jgi:4-aminobutyrate aminotransferase-like enzyme
MLAIMVKSPEIADFVVLNSLKKGLLLFWLLFEPCAVRISPPLTLSEEEIQHGCSIILEVLNSYPNTAVN